MRSDTMVKQEGLKILKEHFGLVDMERFIALLNREHSNYTDWRTDIFENLTIEELAQKADEYSQTL